LKSFKLDYSAFVLRFELIKAIEDPYVRYYDICKDGGEGRRVAVRRYIADDEGRYMDVL
jgi:hypothetical protein